MSANRDKSQKITFIYSNLYDVYRKGKEAAKSAELPQEQTQAVDQKTDPVSDAQSDSKVQSIVNDYQPILGRHATQGLTTGKIIKAADASPFAVARGKPLVQEHVPTGLIGKRIEEKRIEAKPELRAKSTLSPLVQSALKNASTPSQVSQQESINQLKENLKSLNDLHNRLKFMLKELEDLVKSD